MTNASPPAAIDPPPSLIVTTPDAVVREYVLFGSEATIGRHFECQIQLDDTLVSRQHAALRVRDRQWHVEDLGSSNGAFVNGIRLGSGPAPLYDGDLLRVGRSEIRFVESHPHAGATTPDARSTDRQRNTDLEVTLDQPPSTFRGTEEIDASPLRIVLNSVLGPRLVVHDDSGTRECALGNGATTLGRDAHAQVRLVDRQASRLHASVDPENGGFRLRDRGSRNGVHVNGVRVRERRLLEGDVIRIGDARLVFKDGRQQEVARSDSARRPVVVVPGFGGSELWQGSSRLWPSFQLFRAREPEEFASEAEARRIVRQVVLVPGLLKLESFGRLVDFLVEGLGYRPGADLLEFAYDWRRDNRESAEELRHAIDRWRPGLADPLRRVVIVAHSMGGLVARLCLGHPRAADAVERVILLGTPHAGSTRALRVAVAGDSFLPISLNPAVVRQVLLHFVSLYQLLPTYPAAVLDDGSEVDLLDGDGWLAPQHRPYHARWAEFRRDLDSSAVARRVPVTSIFGYGQTTSEALRVRRSGNGTLELVGERLSEAGDGAVLPTSAVLDGTEIHPVRQAHGALYADRDVQRRLRFELLERPES